MSKRALIIGVIILVIGFQQFYSYMTKYNIPNEKAIIADRLNDLMPDEQLEVIKIEAIDDRLLVLCRYDQLNVGVTWLKKGFNGKYKISSVKAGYNTPFGWGFRPFEFRDNNYFVIYGYNPEMMIDTIKFKANEKNYSLSVSGDEHYLFVYSYEQLVDHFPFSEVALTDKDGNDIKEEIYNIFESNEFRQKVIESGKDIVNDVLIILATNLLLGIVVWVVYQRINGMSD